MLGAATESASPYLDGLPRRWVGPSADSEAILSALGVELQNEGQALDAVIEEMARALEPELVAASGRCYFGFVIGGALPASIGADSLAAAWEQNAGAAVGLKWWQAVWHWQCGRGHAHTLK